MLLGKVSSTRNTSPNFEFKPGDLVAKNWHLSEQMIVSDDGTGHAKIVNDHGDKMLVGKIVGGELDGEVAFIELYNEAFLVERK